MPNYILCEVKFYFRTALPRDRRHEAVRAIEVHATIRGGTMVDTKSLRMLSRNDFVSTMVPPLMDTKSLRDNMRCTAVDIHDGKHGAAWAVSMARQT